VPASRVLRKLNTHHVESGLYKALREVGRIAKTAFLLRYFTKEGLCRQIQAALSQQESIHALLRTLFIGQRGELRLRDLDAQMNRISCLHLIVAMVITWNAAYLSAAIERLKADRVPVTDEQLAHILPLMTAHINLLGRYDIDPAASAFQTHLSTIPLRSTEQAIEQLGI
jgi:TnpA family transposase